MAGVFGIFSEEDCIKDTLSGIFYLQNRSEEHCGMAWKNGGGVLRNSTHKGLVKNSYVLERGSTMNGTSAIATVSGMREPVSEFSNKGGMILCSDGNLSNSRVMRNNLLRDKASFSGCYNPGEICDSVLISKIISRESSFEKGIESLTNCMEGDFALIALTQEGIYASRGWGRKPLILGKKEGSYAVSSESVSFINTGFEILRDVEPGETV